jgi:hypothetical protein
VTHLCDDAFANSTLTGRTHPDTSYAAARRALGRTGTARRRVLAALVARELTDEEMQAQLQMSANTQRPRRVELCAHGYVAATAARRKTVTGAWSIVWTVTDAGLEALAQVLRQERLEELLGDLR